MYRLKGNNHKGETADKGKKGREGEEVPAGQKEVILVLGGQLDGQVGTLLLFRDRMEIQDNGVY